MLGCVAYTMCFYTHPFVEGSKLAISKAKYSFPCEHNFSEKLCDLIRLMLTPNPKLRPDIFEIVTVLENFNEIKQIPLNVTFLTF
jgi:AP2-associated kinase